jgi:hypothetical protein
MKLTVTRTTQQAVEVDLPDDATHAQIEEASLNADWVGVPREWAGTKAEDGDGEEVWSIG